MPRDGSGNYTQPFPDVVEGTTIESAVYNGFVHDVEQDLNTPRPILAGGTGASSVNEALDNLSAEKFKQVVTNWDTNPWRAGSFYAATTATGAAPVAAHAFAGIVYYRNATDLIIEATDVTDPLNPFAYIRIMDAGVWGAWMAAGATPSSGDYKFDNAITFPPASGQIRFNNATQNSTTELFISHLTSFGTDNTGVLQSSIKKGYDIFVQDRDEPTKYKLFTATDEVVLSGSDFRVTVILKNAGTDIVDDQAVLISANPGSPVESNRRKNYVVNGAMMISQENGTTASAAVNYYPVDQWYMANVTATLTAGQVLRRTPSGSPNRVRIVTSTVGHFRFTQKIEGSRIAGLRLGTANAKTLTVQFGINAPAGNFQVNFYDADFANPVTTLFSIAAGEALTDVVRTLLLPRSTVGNFPTTNNTGAQLQIIFLTAPSATYELFDVSLTEGTVPETPAFEVPDIASEFLACKRYLEVMSSGGVAGNVALGSGHCYSATLGVTYVPFTIEMRAKPSFSMSSATHFSLFIIGGGVTATGVTAPMITTQGARVDVTVASGLTAGQGAQLQTVNTAYKMIFDARL